MHSPRTYPYHPLPFPPPIAVTSTSTADSNITWDTRNQSPRPGKHAHGEGANISKQHSFIYANYWKTCGVYDLAVTLHIFIAYIYWQVLRVDLLKDLGNVSHIYNCIQGLCKYPQPSNSLKLLFHFLKSTLKRNMLFFPHLWNTYRMPKLFLHHTKEKILSSLSTSIPYINPSCFQISNLHSHPRATKSVFPSSPFSSHSRVTSDTTQL